MKRACEKNKILTVTGILAIHCRAKLDLALTAGQTAGQKIQSFIDNGDAFFINSEKKLVMTPNFTEATEGTRANGVTVPIEGAVEGYTVEFPETLEWSRKLKAIKETCNRMYLVDENEGVFTIYGLGNKAVPAPFDMTSISTAMANGRFGHTTSLPVNTISFKMNLMDDITSGISECNATGLTEFEIVRMGIVDNTISFYSAAKPFNTNDAIIPIAAGTVVDIADFEFSGTYTPTSVTITNGSIVFTGAIPAGTTITQLKPVDGMMSLEPITTPTS
ncbi:MAG TPA: hypothetical protein PLF32_09795 [Bacteroidales bacterium]|nr:hypothetical protein [Bacteroidales bacterium]